VASRGESKKSKLAALLKERSIDFIDERAWAELAMAIAPVSESYLRGLLRESGVRLSPAVEGVNQTGFEDLERTLVALAREYDTSDAMHRRALRNIVIGAKDRARFSAERSKDDAKKAIKEEMLLWMRTWLENPALFAAWVALRKKAAASPPSSPTESRSPEP
jgi:hypothetical protein